MDERVKKKIIKRHYENLKKADKVILKMLTLSAGEKRENLRRWKDRLKICF